MPAWKVAKTTDALIGRLRRVTSELHVLQSELYQAVAEENGNPKKHFATLAPSCEDLSAFRSAVDQLRRSLWFYLDSVAASAMAAPEAKSTNQLQGGTELLHKPATQGPGSDASVSFFDRLNVVIEGYMQQKKAKP